MYKFIWNKIILNIFSLRFFRILLVTILIFSFNIIFIPAVFAQQANPTITPIAEQATAPCYVYDLLWGTSDQTLGFGGQVGGLFQYTSIDSKNSAKYLKPLVEQIRYKDPIFLPTEFKVSDNDDPILGLLSTSTKDLAQIDGNALPMPCSYGKLMGLVPRRKLDIRNGNCYYQGNIIDKTYTFLACAKDNAVGGMVAGGCPVDIDLKNYRNTYSVNASGGGKTPLEEARGKTDDKGNITNEGNTLIKFTFAVNSVLKKTTDFDTAPATKPFADGMKNYFNYYSNIRTTYQNVRELNGKIEWDEQDPQYKSQMDQTILFDQNKPKINLKDFTINDPAQERVETKIINYTGTGTPVTKTIKYQSLGIKNGFINGDQPNFGLWFDYTSGGRSVNTDKKDDLKLEDGNLRAHLVGIYNVNSVNIANNLKNSSFECRARKAKYVDSVGTKDIFVYEWIPSSSVSYAFPTCEQVTGQANTLNNESQIISVSSSIKIPNSNPSRSQQIVTCRPCIIPSLFNTDIFGVPVIGIPTSIGCLPGSLAGVIGVFVRISTMVAGGIALLLITINAFKIILNGDKPEEIKKAQAGINAAVVGLLVLISAVILLNVVGVKIFDLGSFGGSQIQNVSK